MKNSIIENDLYSIKEEIGRDFYKNKTILLSGAAGFIASYFVEYFIFLNEIFEDQNTRVICLVRNLKKFNNKFKHILHSPYLEPIRHDIVLEKIFKTQIDIIIHLASKASPKYYKIDPVGVCLANSIGTNNLLQIANQNANSKFLFFSSGEVYGYLEKDEFIESDFGRIDSLSVRSCYAESKKFGENLCISYNQQFGVDVKIIRPFHTYGPKMNLNDGRVFADFVSNAVSNQDIIIKSDGLVKRSYCYISDAIIAYLKILENGVAGEAYNVGNPNETYTVSELAEIVLSVQSNKRLSVVFQKQNDTNYLATPFTKMIPSIKKVQQLGWDPKIKAPEGFKRTIQSYKL